MQIYPMTNKWNRGRGPRRMCIGLIVAGTRRYVAPMYILRIHLSMEYDFQV